MEMEIQILMMKISYSKNMLIIIYMIKKILKLSFIIVNWSQSSQEIEMKDVVENIIQVPIEPEINNIDQDKINKKRYQQKYYHNKNKEIKK